ncbi:2'-5' RNA ligase family protein [Flavobacterium sp. C4GT6]|uniref:2'-5' RNA ligase family protein n=1 Tax=Flavobacterium sp. C4GT6 TaxID=3103818 RepID=UPI002ED5578A
MPLQNRYFIALIPPQEVCEQVTAFKKNIAINYNSHKALRVIPHITLKTPFNLEEKEHSLLMQWFHNLSFSINKFELQLNGFGCFNNSKAPVIYVQPEYSAQLLSVQQSIIKQFATAFPNTQIQFHDNDYHPHMTIGYRDLTYPEFEKAWSVYKNKPYKVQFEVQGIYLLQHDAKQWNIIAQHLLQE